MYDVVVKKFTFAVSSRDELLVVYIREVLLTDKQKDRQTDSDNYDDGDDE